MKLSVLVVVTFLWLGFTGWPAAAQQHHGHPAPAEEKIGQVNGFGS